MLATIVLCIGPALAALIVIVSFFINRRRKQRLAQITGAMQAAAAAHRNIKRRQMLDAELEQLHEQHRKETLDAQTPDPARADFDNDWLPEPRPGTGRGSAADAPARTPGAAVDRGH